MIICDILLRDHFGSNSSIALVGSGRGIVDGLGDEL